MLPAPALGDISDCAPGYEFRPSSGVGCVQINCASVPDAHYSYTSRCICGSAGSINEDPSDPNKGCYYGNEHTSCPGCLYACVHTDEPCPADASVPVTADISNDVNTSAINIETVTADANASIDIPDTNVNQPANDNANTTIDTAAAPALTTTAAAGRTCTDECAKFLRGRKNAEVVTATGEYPDCQCQIDVRDTNGMLTQTVSVAGPLETTYTYDPASGMLIKKDQINRKDEVEKIRQRLGYKYTEAQIDELLDSGKIDQWFRDQIKDIKTSTSYRDPQFWWQHIVAIWDHGFNGNSADFVDTYQFGRCGDSMQWLERDLSNRLHLGDNPDEPGQKHEAMLSITGEKFSNLLNHTSLLIRPAGIANSEWEDIVKELKQLSGGAKDNPGIQPGNLQNVDPRLLDAKVLDPYKKQITTVREFIKGWSYIRIS